LNQGELPALGLDFVAQSQSECPVMRQIGIILLLCSLLSLPEFFGKHVYAIQQVDNATSRIYLPLVSRYLPPVEMVKIPEGNFLMGCSTLDPTCHQNEYPLHKVFLSSFEIDRFEVTNQYYADCVAHGVCTPPATTGSFTRTAYFLDPEFANYPVIAVTWYQANAYCSWQGKRLPTEAEWEKAARGPSGTPIFPWGNAAATCSLMNHLKSAGVFCVGDTTPAGAYPTGVSPYGIIDMAGNVWEWVADWYDADYYFRYPVNSWPANPAGPSSGLTKVIRGGAWDIGADGARNSRRQNGLPYDLDTATGLRCVR
jgi:formylglycine-generating enzyme required for sulfatase activity